MTDQLTVHARVRLVLDVKLSQPWNADETAGIINKRASAQALEIISAALKNETAVMIQEPEVFMVIANKEVTP